MTIEKAAVFGATGGTGRLIARELAGRGVPVRVVSRSIGKLERDFPGGELERVAADVGSAEAATRALEGCSHVFHCVGLPLAQMHEHLRHADAVTAAMKATGARGVLISGYWSHSPLPERAIHEKHAREGADPKSKLRKEQEDRFLAAGAALVCLPDFYGPESTFSMLNDALDALRHGKKATWPGDPDAPREFVYLPDIAWPIVELAAKDEAFGEEWVLAGAGWVAPRRALELGAKILGREPRLRAVSPLMLSFAALFDPQLREFKDVYPMYCQPVFFDASKLRGLIGPFPITKYEEGVRATLEWLERRPAP